MRAESARVRPPLTALAWRKIFVGDIGGFLGEIVRRSQIASEKAHFAVYVAFENGLPIRSRELAMNLYRGCAGNSRDLSGSFTAALEAAN
jgi:hypothetical protein